MPSQVKAPVNPSMLLWARTEMGLSVEEAAHALGVTAARLDSWEQGQARPTINQVRKAAQLYQQTPAFLLRNGDAPAETPGRPVDFRGRDHRDKLGAPLAREISRAKVRRERFVQLHGKVPHRLPEVTDALAHHVVAAEALRGALGIDVGAQLQFRNDAEALQAWIEAAEGLGVLIFQMSRVEAAACRGFSLYYDAYPVVVLNGGEAATVRIFTLFHELAHLLTRTSALCEVWKGAPVERRCNLIAGEALMPEAVFRRLLGGEDPVDSLSRLATQFKVSQSSVAVRMRDLNEINQRELDEQLAIAAEIAKARREADRDRGRTGGPAHHVLKLRNLGPTYVATVLDALNERAIDIVDAAYYLESKVATVEKMEQALASRSARSNA